MDNIKLEATSTNLAVSWQFQASHRIILKDNHKNKHRFLLQKDDTYVTVRLCLFDRISISSSDNISKSVCTETIEEFIFEFYT